MPIETLVLSAVISLALTPLVRWIGLRLDLVSRPRTDRFHRGVVPFLGGAGAFLAFAIAILVIDPQIFLTNWGLLAGSTLLFLVGLYDDIKELSPPSKLMLQIAAAVLVVFTGYRTAFFGSDLPNILITVVWLVGITNAINLLDNMDGLAGGIALIAAGFIFYFFWRGGQDTDLMVVTGALFGGILGFLVFNFPPARIFMGDNGSLFFGFTLAALAIARKPQASNVFAVMSVPALLFLLPILDTTFVTFTRMLRGQSPAQGGRDHTSHRLVAFGLSVRQTVLVLYGVAIISGIAGAAIEALDYTLSLVLIPIMVISFAVLAAYLSRLKVVDTPKAANPLAQFLRDLTYRRRVLEIALDFFLISIAFYLASWVQAGFSLDPPEIDTLIAGLPFALAGAYGAFFIFGVYRSVWGYAGLADFMLFLRAAAGAGVAIGLAYALLFRGQGFLWAVALMFALFIFLGLAASRSSFRILDRVYNRRTLSHPREMQDVLVFGTGPGGDLAQRWIEQNPELGYRVVGFIEEDANKWGRKINGLDVLGGPEGLDSLLQASGARGILVAPENLESTHYWPLVEKCREKGIWVRIARMELTEPV